MATSMTEHMQRGMPSSVRCIDLGAESSYPLNCISVESLLRLLLKSVGRSMKAVLLQLWRRESRRSVTILS